MQRRSRVLQVFSISFLDVISCALGAVLLLLLQAMTTTGVLDFNLERVSNRLREFEKSYVQLTGLYDSTKEELGEFETAFGELKARYQGQQEDLGLFESAYEDLEARFDASRDELGQFSQAYDQLHTEYNGLLDEMKRLGKVEADYHGLQAKFDATENELGKYKRAYQTLLTRFEATQEELGRFETAYDVLLAKYDGKVRETEQLGKSKEGQDRELADLRKKLDQSDKTMKQIEQAINGVVALKGPMKNVVFLFDTSASLVMDDVTGEPDSQRVKRFQQHTELLKNWIALLSFEKFAVIDFDDYPRPWPTDAGGGPVTQLAAATDDNRELAARFIDSFRADGRTSTRMALERAFQFEGVDTIILFTDGEPTDPDTGAPLSDQQMNGIIRWLQDEHAGIVINTIAIGEKYFNARYGPFLQKIADNHAGTFLGR